MLDGGSRGECIKHNESARSRSQTSRSSRRRERVEVGTGSCVLVSQGSFVSS